MPAPTHFPVPENERRQWRGLKSDGWPTDSIALDGIAGYSFRRVRGASVKFVKCRWFSPLPEPYEGRVVRVQVNTYWITAVYVWPGDGTGKLSSFYDTDTVRGSNRRPIASRRMEGSKHHEE